MNSCPDSEKNLISHGVKSEYSLMKWTQIISQTV